MNVASANKVQLSEDARNALTPFDCYVMSLRGEVDIKVSLGRRVDGSLHPILFARCLQQLTIGREDNYDTY